MTLYTDEIRQLANSYTWPSGMNVEVVEYEHHLAVRIYRDNFETFDGEVKLRAANQIGELINRIRQKGCPCYAEAVKGDGRNGGRL